MRYPVLAPALLSLALWAVAAAPASAQAQTGTGGGPTSTATAPNTSPVGRTMPPAGGNAGAATADDREKRTDIQKTDDKITRGICIGCGPK